MTIKINKKYNWHHILSNMDVKKMPIKNGFKN